MWEDESFDIVAVTGLNIEDDDESVGTSNNEIAMIDEFIPIALTEEWLIKFGFKMEKGADYFYVIKTNVKDVTLEVDRESNRTILFNNKHQHFIDVESVKYVHSLQNLYYSLCGQELILKK